MAYVSVECTDSEVPDVDFVVQLNFSSFSVDTSVFGQALGLTGYQDRCVLPISWSVTSCLCCIVLYE